MKGFFCLLALLSFNLSSASIQQPLSHVVLVSVAPHKYFVEKIAGNTLKVMLMVPAGVSAHSFDPSPKQMLAASQADLWFRLGESFESKAIPALKAQNPYLQIADMREGVNLIYSSEDEEHHHGACHCCGPNSADLHIWLSPKEAKKQALTIAKALSSLYPENATLYQNNLTTFGKELDELDQEISLTLSSMPNRTILVSHPAYAYLARDYSLRQLSIEFEGRDPSPKQLTHMLGAMKAAGIRTLFVQPQYSSKGAKLVAQEIGAKIVTLDPYAENYITSLRDIAQHFANQFNHPK